MKFALASKGFIVNNSKLLLLKRSLSDNQRPGIWELPGGRLETGEDPMYGMKREALEETGIHVEVSCPLTIRHFTRDDGQVITMIVFLCKALDTKVTLSREHSEFLWINTADAKSKIAEFFYPEVEQYLNVFKDLS